MNDQRRRHARRHLLYNGLADGGYLCHGGIHGRAGLEKNLDHAEAVVRSGFDVLDVVDRDGQRALIDVDDALFHLLGIEAGVTPDDADDRNVDGWENIRGRAQQNEGRQYDQQQRGHHKRVRPAQG